MNMVTIGEIVDFIGGGTPSRDVNEYWNGGIPWASVKDFKGPLIDSTLESITHDGLLNSSSTLIPAGHVIMPTRMALGKAAINSIDVAINQDLKALKPKREVDTRYLLHAVLSKAKEIQSHGKGATVQGITIERLSAIQIPLPPLEEQRRIAAILDKSSRLAELSATALNLSQAAEKSLFLNCFSDLPERSDFILEEVADRRSNAIRTGPFGSQLLHSEFTDSGVAVLGIDNAVNNSFEWGKKRFISHDKYQQLQRYTVFPGDLLITIMGTCGRAAVVPDDIPQAINTKHLCAITVDRRIVLPEYLHSYILFHPFASRYLEQRTKGAIMEGLNMTIIKEMPVAVPPLSRQLDWFAQREVVISTENNAKAMKAAAALLGQSLSVNLLGGRTV